MLVASMIVKTDPARAEEVSRQLGRVPNVTTYGVHKAENIVLVAEAHDVAQLENLARYITDTFEDVWGVFPTFLATDEEPAAQVTDDAGAPT